MLKIISFIAILLFSACTHNAPKTALDVSQFGVKKVYTVDLQRDLKIIDKNLKKVFKYQLYTSDKQKYNRDDFHENIAKPIDLLAKIGQNVDEATLRAEAKKAGIDFRNFKFKDGKWWVTGDCESTYLALETFLIRDGVNPQRLYEVYCEVMTDNAKTTSAGGHMFGFYAGADGELYTLEQLPYWRTMWELSTKRFYKFHELRRADKPTNDFRKFPKELIEKIDRHEKVFLRTTNEKK